MSLDARTFSFIEKREEVSIATINGRLKLKLDIGNFQRGLLAGQKPTAATLCYNRRTKEFYIHIVVNREVPFPPKDGNVIGVDRGIYNLATTQWSKVFRAKLCTFGNTLKTAAPCNAKARKGPNAS